MAGASSLIFWVAIIGVFYVFLILPEKKKQKNMKNMMDQLQVGDKIMTKGGVIGKITSISEDNIIISSGPDNTTIELSKLAIGNVLQETDEIKDEPKSIEENKTEEVEDSVEAEENTEVEEKTE